MKKEKCYVFSAPSCSVHCGLTLFQILTTQFGNANSIIADYYGYNFIYNAISLIYLILLVSFLIFWTKNNSKHD